MKKENETFHEYKKRVIDPISSSFCAAKWYNATIWLGHGQTTSCHHPSAHQIPLVELKRNHTAIHNTAHKKMMRKMMQKGERPSECEYCWKVEDIGRDNISDRVHKTLIYEDDDVAALAETDWRTDVDLKTLEISFDRACNFACSYCNPAFSTTWVRDINVNGPYENIKSDTRGHFIDNAPWANRVGDTEEDNPYVQAFWKWWDNGLSENLEEIRVTGGEPIMHKGVWKIFDWFEQNQHSDMRFAINSNLVPSKQSLFDRLIEKSNFVKDLTIYTSNESYGAQSDYIRDGMDYTVWRNNMVSLITKTNAKIVIMMTINSICMQSIVEFLDDMMSLRDTYGHRSPTLSVNILRFPTFQSLAIIPEHIKTKYMNDLTVWFDSNKDKLYSHEITQFQRLIDYMDVVKTPTKVMKDIDLLYHDFKVFYEQYDKRRGKDFRSNFPDFVEWYDSIQEVDTVAAITQEEVYDPASTEAYD